MKASLLLGRRAVLKLAGASAAAHLAGGLAAPFICRAADRPGIPHGLQSGDVTGDNAVIWARTDMPARMRVEISTTDSFKDIFNGLLVDALPESDFTAKALIAGLPADQDIFYRVRFQYPIPVPQCRLTT